MTIDTAFALALTAVNVALWTRTARWMVARCRQTRRSLSATMPVYEPPTVPDDPLRNQYNDAVALMRASLAGNRLTRRDAVRSSTWSQRRWGRAFRACRQAGVFDKDGGMLIDDGDTAHEALVQWRMGQAELRGAGRYVAN